VRAAERLALQSIVLPVLADGVRPPVRDGAFDRVLLDAPCSGLGVLRRRPDARWRVVPSDVDALAQLQRVLLQAAAGAVRPGGRLVYSVCTLTRAETLAVDDWAAAALPEFVALQPPSAPWRSHGRGAILLPSDAHSDGMFVLVLERVRVASASEKPASASPIASPIVSPSAAPADNSGRWTPVK
jgi:16S rRNA (cytosine967-C5)-methyltransferase